MKVLNEINKNNDIIIESTNKNRDFFLKKISTCLLQSP